MNSAVSDGRDKKPSALGNQRLSRDHRRWVGFDRKRDVQERSRIKAVARVRDIDLGQHGAGSGFQGTGDAGHVRIDGFPGPRIERDFHRVSFADERRDVLSKVDIDAQSIHVRDVHNRKRALSRPGGCRHQRSLVHISSGDHTAERSAKRFILAQSLCARQPALRGRRVFSSERMVVGHLSAQPCPPLRPTPHWPRRRANASVVGAARSRDDSRWKVNSQPREVSEAPRLSAANLTSNSCELGGALRNKEYTTGTKNSVTRVATIKPPITARPSGAFCSPPSPIPSAIGNIPIIIANAVMRTGRRRVLPASRAASWAPISRSPRTKLAKLTTKMLLETAIPTAMIDPMNDSTFRVVPVT